MRIVIHYNNGKKALPDPKKKGSFLPNPKGNALDFLNKNKRDMVLFEVSREKEYNGIVVYVDEDDVEEFVTSVEDGGFDVETE